MIPASLLHGQAAWFWGEMARSAFIWDIPKQECPCLLLTTGQKLRKDIAAMPYLQTPFKTKNSQGSQTAISTCEYHFDVVSRYPQHSLVGLTMAKAIPFCPWSLPAWRCENQGHDQGSDVAAVACCVPAKARRGSARCFCLYPKNLKDDHYHDGYNCSLILSHEAVQKVQSQTGRKPKGFTAIWLLGSWMPTCTAVFSLLPASSYFDGFVRAPQCITCLNVELSHRSELDLFESWKQASRVLMHSKWPRIVQKSSGHG